MESIKFATPVDNNNKEWKTKKNYGPAALFTVLLLGTAFLAGKSYGRNEPAPFADPISSLLAMGDASLSASFLETPSNDCGVGDAPASCPEGQEFWSVAGFPDGGGCVGDTDATTICGQLCLDKTAAVLMKKIAMMAPEPKPKAGSCASYGYSTDTGKTFSLKIATKGLVDLAADIFTDGGNY